MADKRISELTAVTSVNSADLLPIVQGGSTQSTSVDVLFRNVPTLKYSGYIANSSTPENISSGALSLTTTVSHVSNATAADIVVTLADGTQGQEKVVLAETLTTNKVVITPTNASGFTTVALNATGSSVKLLFSKGKWYILSTNNVTKV